MLKLIAKLICRHIIFSNTCYRSNVILLTASLLVERGFHMQLNRYGTIYYVTLT